METNGEREKKMIERTEKTKRLGFAQFRFILAAVLLTAAFLKAYQLATTPLPPVIQGNVFTPLLELLNEQHFLMSVVVGEILFALVLIAGICLQWTWLLSLLGFSAFTLVSMVKGLSGETSCGCFGTVTVNPWITMMFDLLIVACLAVFRPKERGSKKERGTQVPRLERNKVLAVFVIWLVLAGLALFAMLSLKQQPHATLGTELEGFDGRRMIHLEPEKWLAKEFPLVGRFVQPEGSEVLKKGNWLVLLVQPNCPDCKQMMADLENRKAERIAIVVIPSQPNEKVPDTSFPTFVLDRQNDWFVSTPCVVKLDAGVCVAIEKHP